MAYFICKNCGYGSASWMGRCPSCQEWSTFVQKEEEKKTGGFRSKKLETLNLTPLSSVKNEKNERTKTNLFEFDRVLGGGLIPGAVVLLTGEPGVGKSTLLLQALKNLKTVYISGEESQEQVKERADRLKINLKNILFSNNSQVEGIIEGIKEKADEFDVVVIDSIQTVHSADVSSAAGSISQLKETTSKLISMAKKLKIPVVIIGHVTKGGNIAGPKTLEHLVDCVLVLEGEKVSNHRILRASKNRFGSIDEIGIFEMKQGGLSAVDDPAAFLESEFKEEPGKTIVGVSEGKRPLFFEIQTLASPTQFSYPKRVVKGVDYNKSLLILAVLRKQLGIPIDNFDIYINVVGGVSVKSTAADLGIAASLISSIKNVPIHKKTVFIGEVGLLGEIRAVNMEEKISQEAKRLRFKYVLSSKNVRNIKELRKNLF